MTKSGKYIGSLGIGLPDEMFIQLYHSVTETKRHGLTLEQQKKWYDEWKNSVDRKDFQEAIYCVEEPSMKTEMISRLGDGAFGIKFVRVGSERAGFVYGNGSCLKIQYEDDDQTERELELVGRMVAEGYGDVLPEIYGFDSGFFFIVRGMPDIR